MARSAGAAARRGRKQPFLARKLWKLPVWAWAVFVVVLLIAGAGAGRDQPAQIQTVDASQGAAASSEDVAAAGAVQAEPAQIPLGLSADFGSSRVEVVGATIRSDGGESYVICEYKWTNNTGGNSMFLAEISEQAFQSGVALEMDYFYDVETNLSTELMSGYSLTVRTVYKLTSPSEEIVFTVQPLLDLEGKYEPLTFTVSPA